MNVHGMQRELLNACPERLINRSQKPFIPVPIVVNVRKIKSANPRQCRHASCRAATKLPANQVKHSSVLSWKRLSSSARISAPEGAPPLVILPGFGNCSADYTAPFGSQQDSIAHFLKERGFNVYVVQIERRDWIRVAQCLTSRSYWSGKSTVDPGYRWYLQRVQAAVDKACREGSCDQVDVIGHSAGGWLARAFIGDALYMKSNLKPGSSLAAQPHVAPGLGVGSLPSSAHQGVRRLVTLGTPHLGPSSGRDMTGGTLTWLNAQWPGACFKDQGIQYTCVAGHLVAGNRDCPQRTLAKYACNSYREVCGDGHGQLGDGLVPSCCAHLEGANNITLEGVFHSISKQGTFADASELVWYGSDEVMDAWLPALL
ncbi:hypothetical protein ABBQ32_009509 [Trebouxia sp. C0010 RCD-2024]